MKEAKQHNNKLHLSGIEAPDGFKFINPKKQRPLTPNQWLNSMHDIKKFCKDGKVTYEVLSKMLANYAQYRVNFEKEKELPKPLLMVKIAD